MTEAITFVVCPCLMFLTMTSLALGDASANHDLSVSLYTLSFTHRRETPGLHRQEQWGSVQRTCRSCFRGKGEFSLTVREAFGPAEANCPRGEG